MIHARQQLAFTMVRRLSLYSKTRIALLDSSGARQKDILADLQSNGISVTRRTVRLFLKKYKQTGSYADKPRSDRRSKFPPYLNGLIHDLYENDDELTSRDIALILDNIFGLEVAESTIRRRRLKLGWVATGPAYCQMIRDANKQKRLDFCLDAQRRGKPSTLSFSPTSAAFNWTSTGS